MYSTTQSIMLPNARHHSLYPFLLEIEECEDCYQKDQDEDNEEEEKNTKEKRCEICDRNAYHQNDWHCSQGLIGPKIKEWFEDEEEELEKPSNKNQCDFCAGGQNTTRHPNTYGCAEFFCGLEEEKEETSVKN